MAKPTPTEIRITERGDETHESWLLIRASRISSTPGARLFDSEIAHQHFIRVSVQRCTRKRALGLPLDLHRDWHYPVALPLIEVDMSEAQWGAFVSSFGSSGVPATLSLFDGQRIPGVAGSDSRLARSHEDVREASRRAVEKVQDAQRAVQEAFERGAGKREMRDLLRTLQAVTGNLPSNMAFAAESLSAHAETVVTKMRSDVEGMVMRAAQAGVALDSADLPALEG